jgi:hypothetical protein
MRDKHFREVEDTFAAGLLVMQAKNEDYAKDADPYSNFRFAAQAAGISMEQGMLYLLGIKLARLENLISAPPESVNNEPLDDTLLDLINYAAILKAYRALKNSPEPEYAYGNADAVAEPADAEQQDSTAPPTDTYVADIGSDALMFKLRSLLKKG